MPWPVLIAVGTGTFMSALDGSVANTVLPVLTHALHGIPCRPVGGLRGGGAGGDHVFSAVRASLCVNHISSRLYGIWRDSTMSD
jgi:hypothetical protein